jgi:hypothetical protein
MTTAYDPLQCDRKTIANLAAGTDQPWYPTTARPACASDHPRTMSYVYGSAGTSANRAGRVVLIATNPGRALRQAGEVVKQVKR